MSGNSLRIKLEDNESADKQLLRLSVFSVNIINTVVANTAERMLEWKKKHYILVIS